jgi:hypothetical protein
LGTDTDFALEKARMRDRLQVMLLSGRESQGCGFPLLRKPFLQDDLVRTMQRTIGLC